MSEVNQFKVIRCEKRAEFRYTYILCGQLIVKRWGEIHSAFPVPPPKYWKQLSVPAQGPLQAKRAVKGTKGAVLVLLQRKQQSITLKTNTFIKV